MASAPLEVVDQVVSVPLGRITVGDRLRPVDPVWAAALGKIMVRDGQKTPIDLCRLPGSSDFLLVAGGHRLEGMRLEGQPAIKAIIGDAGQLSRRKREISENLWRKGLDPLDRAAFVAELITIEKLQAGLEPDQDGRAASAQARWQQGLKADAEDASLSVRIAYGWTDAVAETVGLSRQTIYRDLELHRGLRPDLAAALRGKPIATNAGQLRALAVLPEADQRQVVAMIMAGDAASTSEALGMMRQRPTPSPDAKAWSAFIGGWSRMSAAKRREALRELVAQGLPTGVKITFEGDAGT